MDVTVDVEHGDVLLRRLGEVMLRTLRQVAPDLVRGVAEIGDLQGATAIVAATTVDGRRPLVAAPATLTSLQ